MRTITRRITNLADWDEAQYQAMLALPRIAAALEQIATAQIAMPTIKIDATGFNEAEIDALFPNTGE